MSDKNATQKIIGIDLGTTNSCVAVREAELLLPSLPLPIKEKCW